MKAANWHAAVAGQRLEAANRQTEAACLRSYRSDVDCGTDICMARPQPATQQRLRICGTEFGDDDRYRIHSVNAEPADSCMNFSNTLLRPARLSFNFPDYFHRRQSTPRLL